MIYLDYNATHPPYADIIINAHEKYFLNYGNSSGPSAFAQRSQQIVEESRKGISDILQVDEKQIIFTSSATEANFLAIQIISNRLKESSSDSTISAAVSPLEHPSSIEALRTIPSMDIHTLALDEYGQIDLIALEKLIQNHDLKLLVCSLVHNETGIIQPWEDLFELVCELSLTLICDVVQVVSRLQKGKSSSGLSIDLFLKSQYANIFFIMGGHKIGAGFGTGVLVLPKKMRGIELSKFTPFYHGRQEYSLRPGSHNIASIIAFKKVLHAKIQKTNYKKLLILTQEFENGLRKALQELIDIRIIGADTKRLAGTTMVILPEIPIDFLLIGLDEAGIVVSTGTSCRSYSRVPSSGLLALGLNETEALQVIRFSYDEYFSLEKQNYVLQMTQEVIKELL